MTANEPNARDDEGPVDLHPLDTRPEPHRYVPRPDRPAPGHGGDYGRPVPEEPLHLCPKCDYILTGLTSRRCPECGTPFTLLEARRHADRLSPAHKLDRRAVRWDQFSLYGGIALQVAGMTTPMIVFRGKSTMLDFWIVCVAGGILIIASLYKVYLQRTWPEAMLLAGLASVTFAAVLVVIMW